MCKRNMILLVFVIFVLSFLSSCASFIHGRSQVIKISSDPKGATVFVNEDNKGKTPLEIEMKRKRSHIVRLEMEGYQDEKISVKKRLSLAYLGNLGFLYGAPIGLTIDLINGAMYGFKNDSIEVVLKGSSEDAVLPPIAETPIVVEEKPDSVSEKKDPGEEKLNIAIMDLTAIGVGNHVSLLLSEKLRSILFESGEYNVMNREDMAKVMEEQSFQRSEDCDNMQCYSEIGKMLGVKKIITGSVGKLGSLYSITLKQIDIESSKNDKITNITKKCKEHHLFKLIKRAADDLRKKKEEK
jgi:hypothetical protein